MRGGSSGNIPHAPYLARDESVDLPYCLQNNSVTRFYVCALATTRASWVLRLLEAVLGEVEIGRFKGV
jgi:hypothetical protein